MNTAININVQIVSLNLLTVCQNKVSSATKLQIDSTVKKLFKKNIWSAWYDRTFDVLFS